MLGELSDEIRLMAEVEAFIPDPRWRALLGIGELVEVLTDSSLHVVYVTTVLPLGADSRAVYNQGPLVPAPHSCRWVISPAFSLAVDGAKKLERLYPLFPEPSIVQGAGRLHEIWVRQKCLHVTP